MPILQLKSARQNFLYAPRGPYDFEIRLRSTRVLGGQASCFEIAVTNLSRRRAAYLDKNGS